MQIYRQLLLPIAGAALLFSSCSKEEEPSQPANETVAQEAAQEEAFPEMNEMESLQKEETAVKLGESAKSAVQPSASGLYVLQVGVWDNAPSARKQARDLEAAGIPAYVVKVVNPGGLDGDFWRVRVGYFSTVPDARQYGEILKPKGIAFWIDNRSNDEVGAPAAAAYEEYPSAVMPAEQEAPSSDQVQEAAVEEAAPAATAQEESAEDAGLEEGWD